MAEVKGVGIPVGLGRASRTVSQGAELRGEVGIDDRTYRGDGFRSRRLAGERATRRAKRLRPPRSANLRCDDGATGGRRVRLRWKSEIRYVELHGRRPLDANG